VLDLENNSSACLQTGQILLQMHSGLCQSFAQICVIGIGDGQEFKATCPKRLNGVDDVTGVEGNVLDAGAAVVVDVLLDLGDGLQKEEVNLHYIFPKELLLPVELTFRLLAGSLIGILTVSSRLAITMERRAENSVWMTESSTDQNRWKVSTLDGEGNILLEAILADLLSSIFLPFVPLGHCLHFHVWLIAHAMVHKV